MEINIKEESENKLFSRKEIVFTATYSGSKTPSREEIKEEICKKLSLNPDLTTVIKIAQTYGSNSSEVIVHSYTKKEAMESLVRKPKEKKAAGAPATAKAPAAAAKPEAKKEEKKEEHKEKTEHKKEEKAPEKKEEPKK